jgi:hypothetical protein
VPFGIAAKRSHERRQASKRRSHRQRLHEFERTPAGGTNSANDKKSNQDLTGAISLANS